MNFLLRLYNYQNISIRKVVLGILVVLFLSEILFAKEITVPENAYRSGNAWYCNTGYRKVGSECKKLTVPANAYVSGNAWYCNKGFKKTNNGKACKKMTADEARKQEILLQQIRRGYIGEPCDRAYNRCTSECSDEIYNYDTGNYISNTDVASNCEDACRRGRNYCEDEDKDEQCYEFKRACRNDCPSDVYDYDSGDYLYNTDVNSMCEDACRSGERACE